MSNHHCSTIVRTACLATAGALLLGAQEAPPTPRPATGSESPQATMLRRARVALPPSGWRTSGMVEGVGAADVADGGTAGFPGRQGLVRTQLRVGFPTYRRDGMRTIVTNELGIDQYDMDYAGGARPSGVGACPNAPGGNCPAPIGAPAAPRYLSLQHELLASQAVGSRWRVSGILFSALHTADPDRLRGDALRLQGGAFVTRTYRPTLQVGGGVLAINVYPYVIPTVRLLHIGRKWRTDILIPRGESFYEVSPTLEVGGQFRFFGNRWDMNDTDPALRGRTTMTFTHLGPALNWRPSARLTVSADGGVLLRRFRVDAEQAFLPVAPPTTGSLATTRIGSYDPEASGYLRLRATWQLR